MPRLQEEFACSTGDFVLMPGEYEGPLHITRPCVVDGSQATIWVKEGPALSIEAANVTVKNLRVEVTSDAGQTAIQTNDPHSVLLNVAVKGQVVGLASEAADWRLPAGLELGEFAAGQSNSFILELDAPARAVLDCTTPDVELYPAELKPGRNRITLQIGGMRHNTILYGELLVRTGVLRRIYVHGKALENAPQQQNARPACGGSGGAPVQLPTEVIAPQVSAANVSYIQRGQRLSLGEQQGNLLKVAYEQQGTRRPMEIDTYVFLLGAQGRVRGDNDLIFFGNERSGQNEVRVVSQSGASSLPLALIDLTKAAPDVERIAVCYAIYGDDPSQNFFQVISPVVRIFSADQELYRCRLEELNREKTVVALELYRYKGEWKMHFVGAGYNNGIKRLCESYGVEVE